MPWYKNKLLWTWVICVTLLNTVVAVGVFIFIEAARYDLLSNEWGIWVLLTLPLQNLVFYFILFSLLWGFFVLIKNSLKALGSTVSHPLNHKRLLQAKELYDAGIYTEEEFQAKIAELKK